MKTYSILVVDDEPSNFDVIESLLINENYELHYASSGREALESLEMIPLDLILLDVMMPEMDGIEVCSRIKGNSQWQSIPIIIVTALTEKEDLARCLNAGADDFLSKPVNRLELRARVNSMIRIKQNYSALQASLKLREDMVYMLVHDLRSPLSNIILALDILDKFELSREKQKQKVADIQLSVHKLRVLIDDLLVMARLEAGKFSLNFNAIDLSIIIAEVIKDFQAIASDQNIEIITNFPEFSNIINIDETMFERMLDNLLANALKFSPNNSQVTISLEYTISGDAKIEIADYGKGIPNDLKQNIFNKYEIGNTMESVSQIGLGLAFCKMVIDAHGGKITVQDNQPQGAIFQVILPNRE